MTRFLIPIFVFFLLLIPLQLLAATSTIKYITMNLPETVIAEAINQILPLSLNGTSSRLDGTITIINISNFRVKNQQILCHLDLEGNNLHLVTKVANQNIHLKLGSARINFDCDVRLRYDQTRKTLYIRPMANDVQGTDALKKGDIGQALVLLLNGQEFPITMQSLKPIIAVVSDKIINIKTKIVDIKAIEGALQVSLEPVITASRRPQNTSPQTTVQ